VLLLDEPSQSLDPVAAASFRETLTKLARERGVGGLFVTHDLHEAAATATRVTALVDGRVAFTQPGGGAAAELERALVEAVGP
jgi:ABC-type sulfate/molybdate transport systems ATPase subunit